MLVAATSLVYTKSTANVVRVSNHNSDSRETPTPDFGSTSFPQESARGFEKTNAPAKADLTRPSRSTPEAASVPQTTSSVADRTPLVVSAFHSSTTGGPLEDGQAPVAPIEPPTEWTPLALNTPGTSLVFAGQRAVVVATKPVPNSSNPALSITIAPVAAIPNAENPIMTQTSETAYQENPVSRRRGFTYEEELFRTKWGWTAHDQVQQILREDMGD